MSQRTIVAMGSAEEEAPAMDNISVDDCTKAGDDEAGNE
jgi:hypothetical protein